MKLFPHKRIFVLDFLHAQVQPLINDSVDIGPGGRNIANIYLVAGSGQLTYRKSLFSKQQTA
jgi:hypothetical protein